MPRWIHFFWYNFFFALSYVCLVLGFSFRMIGSRFVPRKGPVLIIVNHQSFLDPMAAGVTCSPRPVEFLARRTLFKPPWFGWLLTTLRVHPIDQDGFARGGLMTVWQMLDEGKAVVIYPEGTRTEDGSLSPLKPGILLLLRKKPVPILPVAIIGAFEAMPHWAKWPKLSPLFLPVTDAAMAGAIGKPLDGKRISEMPRDEALAELTRELEKVMAQAQQIKRKV